MPREGLVDPCPFWRLAGPDGGAGTGKGRVIKRAVTHDDEMGARLGGAEQMCSALWAEVPVHDIAAVGDAAVVARRAFDCRGNFNRVAREYQVDCGITAGEVLAQPAPAQAHGNGLRRDAKAHRLAETTTGDFHGAILPAKRCPFILARMKLYCWNVNGIRAVVKKGTFQKFIAEHKPDILCLQETKAEKGQAEIDLPDYHEYWNSAEKKGYSGTAIFSRQEPIKVINGFPDAFSVST